MVPKLEKADEAQISGVVFVTGSGGLVGSESARYYLDKGLTVIGIDNNQREFFFGNQASVAANINKTSEQYKNYVHYNCDIRDKTLMEEIFEQYSTDVALIIHTAAQPSHDWAASAPCIDFDINARATLTLLELTRKHAPRAVFIYTSTNKVYGDNPNSYAFDELETRYSPSTSNQYRLNGFDESLALDGCTHSLFGVSKLSADLLCQEYGKYFGLQTGIFRPGCVTGAYHAGAKLHGFLSYLVKSCVSQRQYNIIGYKGKQVRDNIHASDLVRAFDAFANDPHAASVFNIGGGMKSHTSVLESITKVENLANIKVEIVYSDSPRIGDHIWYVTDNSKFESMYPCWSITKTTDDLLVEIISSVL